MTLYPLIVLLTRRVRKDKEAGFISCGTKGRDFFLTDLMRRKQALARSLEFYFLAFSFGSYTCYSCKSLKCLTHFLSFNKDEVIQPPSATLKRLLKSLSVFFAP
jgi:hypothetical protein